MHRDARRGVGLGQRLHVAPVAHVGFRGRGTHGLGVGLCRLVVVLELEVRQR